MNVATLYKKTYQIYQTMSREENNIAEERNAGGNGQIPAGLPLRQFLTQQLLQELEKEIENEPAKKTTKAAVKRVLKDKGCSGYRNEHTQHPVSYDSFYWIGSGSILIRLNPETADFLPEEPTENPESVNYIQTVCKVMKTAAEESKEYLTLPTPAELRAYIDKEKAKGNTKQIRYCFGENLPMVNAEYLLDILCCVPDPVCRIAAGNPMKPLYFIDPLAGNAAILLPIKK